MARPKNISASQASGYYDKDDYYTKDSASPSSWHGKGAEALGLSGPVRPDDFKALVRGELPDGTALHRGGINERRAGTDFEFSAPKSFSIQALVLGDDRLVRAHQEAVAVARQRIEALTATRVTQDGKTTVETTGNAVIAEFLHTTSRAGDPDLHSHVVALNITQRADGQWRSVDNTAMFKEQRLMYEIYLSELARGAHELGYDITKGKHGNPELAHISREQIEGFSNRAAEIEAALAAQGLTLETATAVQKKAAVMATRDAKQDYDREELARQWQARAKELGVADVRSTRERNPDREAGLAASERQSARAALDFALTHLGEREAAFDRHEVLAVALRESRGDAGYKAIETELKRRESSFEVLHSHGGQRLTTRQATDIERRILAIEEDGRRQVAPIASAEATARHLAERELTIGQAQAVELAATSGNSINGVQGVAGSGKTTALREFQELAERQGYKVQAVAPSHSAVKALNESGIEARTLQGWLADREATKTLNSRTVLVVDEAGLVGNRNLLSTLERARNHDARVLLVGDNRQYQSVDAGRAFIELQKHGMATVRMSEFLRQRDGRIRTAARLSLDEPARALSYLEIREIANAGERYQRIAQDYAGLSRTGRDGTLILTGTNEARAQINQAVRSALKERGELDGAKATIQTFQRKDMTTAEQKRLDRFREGDALWFQRSYRSLGVERGEVYKVTKIADYQLIARNEAGKEIAVQPARLSGRGLVIGRIETREIAAGESLRITGTDRVLGVRNGERGVVESVSRDGITLKAADGTRRMLTADRALPVEYGYAATGHSSQGLGAERVLLDKDTKARTTDHRSFYTDLTRAREAAVIYTNDRRALPQAIVRQSEKTAALDVSGENVRRQRAGASHEASNARSKQGPSPAPPTMGRP
ncbi:MobF family relaxase [Nevskia soli]|uniref:MobF family relaxase n=1 Tax=Nevskia soli TaxID=418856 RepID=UPI0004A6F4E1|nr:MobF family relaxase [Nevskia soli]